MATTELTSAQLDRAAGVMLATACGDALGAPYEFNSAASVARMLEGLDAIPMKGGGGFGWAPGEWTDDTSMAIPLLQAVADAKDLRDESVQDEVVAAWIDWARTAPDVGSQTRAVLSGLEPSAAAARVAAKRVHDATGRSAGNGSLMRTAPVVLAYLDDPAALADAARAISDLTHFETDAGDACVLWTLAIRHAILAGELNVRAGLDALPAGRRGRWATLLAEAEQKVPADFQRNPWVVEALQGAWSAIATTTQDGTATHLRRGLEAAVRGGKDTDTVAAIAGGLIGARYGASAVPSAWKRIVHGWPGLRARDLMRLSLQAVGGAATERIDYAGYGDIATLVRHPHDEGVWLGAVGSLDALPDEVDAVVSLCRVGTAQVSSRIEHHVEVWLIDKAEPHHNPNLDFVLTDAADAIAALRTEGRTVLLHCVQAQSRTPTVAALYAARHKGVPAGQALAEVSAALPAAWPNPAFREFLREL
ncbi:ADP-ribosylglycohydrolase family protein [Diaminobutyricimonas sp. LJ205]|uniref:ADP-ribosylglycohydrolase family protein n=1 Tax=Diaminobutyricimonas sp. LJ205 TaxID=2683590 RepID=UPI0012F4E45F|nr:ADP-ribosylglycohydrolase family protein [Diaminobutyricimonas sp. LJ205]